MIKQIVTKVVRYECSVCKSVYDDKQNADRCLKRCEKHKLLLPQINNLKTEIERLLEIAKPIIDLEADFGYDDIDDLLYDIEEIDNKKDIKAIKKRLKEISNEIGLSMKESVKTLTAAGILKEEVLKLSEKI